ncbi:MAG TPA: hypothetical protein V6D16_23145 [Candidatus Obscuribacterales bacterium]
MRTNRVIARFLREYRGINIGDGKGERDRAAYITQCDRLRLNAPSQL